MSRSKPKAWNVQFVRMAIPFLQHPVVCTLPGSAARLLLLLASRHNGRNNGSIFLSQREVRRLLGMSNNGIKLAYEALEARKIIVKTSPGEWATRKAPTWRLTFLADNGDIPTNEYQLWTVGDGDETWHP